MRFSAIILLLSLQILFNLTLQLNIPIFEKDGFKVKLNSNPPYSELKIFSKFIDVFQVRIYATNGVENINMVHAAKILACYIDNNRDGEVDNLQVWKQLLEIKSTLIMFANQKEIDKYSKNMQKLRKYFKFQDLENNEVYLNSTRGKFDASLEEILHLYNGGYIAAYPKIFDVDYSSNSNITRAMDKARGGKFKNIPSSYPKNAWFTYDDQTCDYICQTTEYFYWALTSILGGQSFPGRKTEIKDEWKLNTRELVEKYDKDVYHLLTNKEFKLPTILPNDTYVYNPKAKIQFA